MIKDAKRKPKYTSNDAPPELLSLAEKRYYSELNQIDSDKKTHNHVDAYKDELRNYHSGLSKSLSAGAVSELAAHALHNNLNPENSEVSWEARRIIDDWRAIGLETSLSGPLTSNHALIRRPDFSVPLGWLDLTEREPGRPPYVTGKNNTTISIRAVQAAIETLATCWNGKFCGSKDNCTPSRAARFFHQFIETFAPNVTVENVNSVIYRMNKKMDADEPCRMSGNMGGYSQSFDGTLYQYDRPLQK